MSTRELAETVDAIRKAKEAHRALLAHIQALDGQERREAVRKALDAGYGASELARGLNISRTRLYQLKEGK